MKVEETIQQHPLFANFSAEYLAVLTVHATEARFSAGDFLFREGQESSRFHLIQSGRVSVEVSVPGHGAIEIKNLGEGDILGWSWLFPPYSHHSDARALEQTRTFAFNGKALREQCDLDPILGYDLMKRFARIMMSTLQSTRLQLIDLHRPAPDARAEKRRFRDGVIL